MEKALPEECWELILKRLTPPNDDRHLGSASLTCKRFLSITDRVRQKIPPFNKALYRNRCEALYRALERFPNIQDLGLHRLYDCDNAEDASNPDVDTPVLRIASFGISNIQSLTFYSLPKAPLPSSFRELGSTLKNLKRLVCWDVKSLGDVHIVAIADASPLLEELGIVFRNSKGCSHWTTEYPQLSIGLRCY